MPNLENLIDMIAEKVDKEGGETWYSSVDMTYAYGQVPIHELTKNHCNFQIVGVKSTGTNVPIHNRILWINGNADRISKIDGPHSCKYK